MDFLQAVDAAVDEALPPEWPRVPLERLARQRAGVAEVRHAFALWSPGAGENAGADEEGGSTGPPPAGGQRRRGPYLGIVALPRRAVGLSEAQAARELTALRDQSLARGGHLLLLYEQEGLDSLDELGGFIATQLDLPHPRWLALGCGRDAGGVWRAEPTPSGKEPLAGILGDLWRGELRFTGPRVGRQTVGVELMRDACWCCEQPIATVTGLVFPDRPVTDWAGGDWRYYRRLLPLVEIEPRTLAALAAQVEQWLRTETGGERITPLGVRSSLRPPPLGRRSTWAALCPDCGALRGAFLVGADRLDLLLDGESRKTGRLFYRPWEIEVGSELLKALAAGTELSVYACPFGWRRARVEASAGPLESPPGGPLRLAGMVSAAAGSAPEGAAQGAARPFPLPPPPPAPEILADLVAEAERQAAAAMAGAGCAPARGLGVVAAAAPAAVQPEEPFSAAMPAMPAMPDGRPAPAPAGMPRRRRVWRALAGVRAWAVERRSRRRARG